MQLSPLTVGSVYQDVKVNRKQTTVTVIAKMFEEKLIITVTETSSYLAKCLCCANLEILKYKILVSTRDDLPLMDV